MAKPLGTDEIEDVLSSIRRLVSEDLRPATARQSATAEAVAAALRIAPVEDVQAPASAAPAVVVPQSPEPGPKLLLTPALRVVAPDTNLDASAEIGQGAGSNTAEVEPQARALGAVLSRLRASLQDDRAPHDPATASIDPAFSEETAALSVSDVTDPIPQFFHRDRPSLDLPTATKVTETRVIAAAAEPVDEAAPMAAARAEAAPELAVEFGKPEPLAYEAPPAAFAPPDEAVEDWADVEDEVLSDIAEDVEAALFGPATMAPSMPEPNPAPPEPVDNNQESVDPDQLRELVRDLIREELAGELGERITRNIRKLVRTEISRALSMRDFD